MENTSMIQIFGIIVAVFAAFLGYYTDKSTYKYEVRKQKYEIYVSILEIIDEYNLDRLTKSNIIDLKSKLKSYLGNNRRKSDYLSNSVGRYISNLNECNDDDKCIILINLIYLKLDYDYQLTKKHLSMPNLIEKDYIPRIYFLGLFITIIGDASMIYNQGVSSIIGFFLFCFGLFCILLSMFSKNKGYHQKNIDEQKRFKDKLNKLEKNC